MAVETERKFLVNDLSFIQKSIRSTHIVQAYIMNQKDKTIRVRISGEKAYLTIKGETKGCSCPEYEYEIPLEEALEIIESFCGQSYIEKTRYYIPNGALCWEVDVFEKNNNGLIVAEIELPDENTTFETPDWIGKEVTGDPRYYNSYIINNPFKDWL